MKKLEIFIGDIFVHTVDANKTPNRQKEALYKYLTKHHEKERLHIYTNSIYVINALTVLQGYHINNVKCEYSPLPFDWNVRFYEILEDGTKVEIETYKGMISDENMLNNAIGEANEEYDKILEKKNGWII
jgi:hypothetical protein